MAETKKPELRIRSIKIPRDASDTFGVTEFTEEHYEFELLDSKQHVRVRNRKYPDRIESHPYSSVRFQWADPEIEAKRKASAA